MLIFLKNQQYKFKEVKNDVKTNHDQNSVMIFKAQKKYTILYL